MSHATRRNESCHTYERIMSHNFFSLSPKSECLSPKQCVAVRVAVCCSVYRDNRLGAQAQQFYEAKVNYKKSTAPIHGSPKQFPALLIVLHKVPVELTFEKFSRRAATQDAAKNKSQKSPIKETILCKRDL